MDNNVSKNTFSHKFFKLRFTKEKTAISIKYLLKQQLLQTLDSYRQQVNIHLDLKFFSDLLERKITPLQPSQDQLEFKKTSNEFFSKLPIQNLGYSCPIAFSLSPYLLFPTQRIAETLIDLLVLHTDYVTDDSFLQLRVEVVSSGWINFYLEPQALVNWLDTQSEINHQLAKISGIKYKLEITPGNLFSVQYVHARCCCLLRLGAKEKLIILEDDTFNYPAQQLAQFSATSWLDEQQNVCLTSKTEYALLRQLLIVTDSYSFAEKSSNWVKLALNLSTAVEVFLAECRFLGQVRQKKPKRAIARLGLIALSQYWLQRILLEKLEIAAPISL